MVMRECVYEAFWYRSLPLASVTGVCVKLGVSSGKIRHTRYGSWPIVLGAGSMAYIVGKLSYIFGENCARKFVEQVEGMMVRLMETNHAYSRHLVARLLKNLSAGDQRWWQLSRRRVAR